MPGAIFQALGDGQSRLPSQLKDETTSSARLRRIANSHRSRNAAPDSPVSNLPLQSTSRYHAAQTSALGNALWNLPIKAP
eukprot:CAMPEP_0204346370 /NCGR_PEP_ID=MMETSP0469-20131031/27127_1 /ASSEMBLY_ACC=CAM_ASM_000384 /TAXON_ID=2969 /ORGANISM="Oxyrrhis marina" /LENGTH=79 /DNA_ID=CAMNT_0051331977 /DNA_START=723 /DNA_END=959 /DNA_ORIENTATION=-